VFYAAIKAAKKKHIFSEIDLAEGLFNRHADARKDSLTEDRREASRSATPLGQTRTSDRR